MQPDNLSNAINAVAPQGSPAQSPKPSGDLVFRDKPKKNTGMIVGMIILAMLAAGGIGFGVWAYLAGNQKEAELNNKITELSEQSVEEDISVDESNTEVVSYRNPVIKSNNTEEVYNLYLMTSKVMLEGSEETQYLDISIDENQNVTCNKFVNDIFAGDCKIEGLEGNVYRIIEFGSGQTNWNNNIGFIMTDGTVKYLPLYDSVKNNNYAIRGNLRVDGYVVDAFDIGFHPSNSPTGGGVATVFVFSDGSFVKYDESMLR